MSTHHICTDLAGNTFKLTNYLLDEKHKHVFFVTEDGLLLVAPFEMGATAAKAVDLQSAYSITEGAECFIEVSDLSDLDEAEAKSMREWLIMSKALTDYNQRLLGATAGTNSNTIKQ